MDWLRGTPRFGNVISGLMRDTGTLMAERSDRHDLAIELLEKARQHRPNDPRPAVGTGTDLPYGRPN